MFEPLQLNQQPVKGTYSLTVPLLNQSLVIGPKDVELNSRLSDVILPLHGYYLSKTDIFYSFVLLASPILNILLGRLTMGGLPIQNSSSVISLQSQKDQRSETVASGPDSKPRKKICCACPETKKLRDECVVEHGEAACQKWIEAHRKCLRAEGFNV
ncbi:Cytochrome c oxidase copper chaperone 1 [Sesamum alatum]|uniref:Cytochrome c oxidase copper chaperone 1 n=1 Tax=Sesamum alatum TaxID=300844 RepID=A0AAE1XZB0_9LAMI|nr:Cytochrome c oxidase copper chaperone 1 [Sesamum alatum]